MKYQAVEYIMDQLDIEVFSVAQIGSLDALKDIYDLRESREDLSGFEPSPEHRCSPQGALNGAKTVISVAVPYRIKNRKTSGTPRGFITNMAWEYDYHDVVKEKLAEVQEALLQAHPDGQFLIAVDTGPINDRMTAYGSGLGWIGRNQFIIDDRIGSGFYIGIIITDFEVEGAPPWREDFVSKCRNCRKCQSSCPANALTGDFDFHGQRCISTLTQLKRILTYDERYRIGRNLYGCDICQWACPFNNQVSRVPEELCRTRANQVEPFDIIEHSNKSFKREFGKMGFAWRGLKVYKRNALIVIGNDRKQDDFDSLEKVLFTLPEDLLSYGIYAMMMISPRKTVEYLDSVKHEDEAIVSRLKEESDRIAAWMRYKFRNMDTQDKIDWLI